MGKDELNMMGGVETSFILRGNASIARDVYRMELSGDTSAFTNPGQFANVKVEGLYLRRPISVCRMREGALILVYKVVGRGTAKMAAMKPEASLNLLTGLGNGFDVKPAFGKKILLAGGGVGLPPLLGLMEALHGQDVTCAMGFGSHEDVFFEKEFKDLGAKVLVTTVDGTAGKKGLITDAIAGRDFDYYFACGPMPMLRAIHALLPEGQLSLEERMGCGFGACMGCSCQTKAGVKRLCVEGPVLTSGEVVF